MRVSEVLGGSIDSFLELSPRVEEHLNAKENPHGVTNSQVGLGNVTNHKQATEKDFLAHKTSATLDHPNLSVTTSKLAGGAVTAEKIAPGAVGEAAIKPDTISEKSLTPALRNRIAGKVDGKEGMGLSQNSFTDAEKAKLGAITVKDGELFVDTAALVLKDAPLRLRKTGGELIRDEEEKQISKDTLKEILATDEDRVYRRLFIAARDAADNYVVYCEKRDGTVEKFLGPQDTQCHCLFEARVHFAEANANEVTIRGEDGQTVWNTFTVSHGPITRLQNVFILSDRVVIIYMGGTSATSLFAASFDHDGNEAWEFVTQTARLSNHEGTEVYDRRFRRAVMEGNDLYIAPVLDTSHPYAVLRINAEGELTGKYMKLGSFTKSEEQLIDIFVSDGYIYGFKPSGQFVKIHTESGVVYKTHLSGVVAAGIRGLNVYRDDVAVMAYNSRTGKTWFYKTPKNSIATEQDMTPTLDVEKDMGKEYLICRHTLRGYECLWLNDGKLTASIYRDADIYTVI